MQNAYAGPARPQHVFVLHVCLCRGDRLTNFREHRRARMCMRAGKQERPSPGLARLQA